MFYRGLLLPKVVVGDIGGTRTDAGMLGYGIYFADSARFVFTDLIIYNAAVDNLVLLVPVVATTTVTVTRALSECKPSPSPKFETKVVRDSNPDFQINPDPDVCQICTKMLWMHNLVGISYFAKDPLGICVVVHTHDMPK